MNEPKPLSVSELAAHLGARVVGDGAVLIHRVASLEAADDGDIAYVEDEKFFDAASASHASCVIVPEGAAVKAACRIVRRSGWVAGRQAPPVPPQRCQRPLR